MNRRSRESRAILRLAFVDSLPVLMGYSTMGSGEEGKREQGMGDEILYMSGFISPVIIAAFVVYSFAGLAWRTPWPYVAGAVVVALQAWKRNPLLSIIAGTVIYMLLVNLGAVK